MIRLISTHLAGNAILLWLGYYWLGIGESSGLYLAYSAAIFLLFAIGALWLHGSSLVYFRQAKSLAVQNLLPLFVLAVVVGVVYILLDRAYESFGHEAFVIGSYSTMKIRRPVAPSSVLKGFHVFIFVLRWLVFPAFALPLACSIANNGWKGMNKQAFRPSRKWLFWIECLALLLLAFWVPFKLFFWIPKVPNFWLELISVALRIGVGYLLFVASMLLLEYFTSKESYS